MTTDIIIVYALQLVLPQLAFLLFLIATANPYASLIGRALNEAIMLMEIEAIDEEGSGDENNMNLHER